MNSPRKTSAIPFLSRKLIWGFRRYVRRFVQRNFNAVRVANSESLANRIEGPLICYVNHPGWWDPMAAVLISDTFLSSRQFRAPMDASSLKSYPILERLGFFPLDRESKTGLKEFLRTCQSILADGQSVLWITPTGRFTDVRDSAPFMNGLGHLAGLAPSLSLLPVAVEYPFWNERYPEMLIEFGSVLTADELPVNKFDRTTTLHEHLTKTQSSLAQKAILRDPRAFQTIAVGRAGIGGIYDFFRRMFAFVRGDRFHRRHGQTVDIGSPSQRGDS